VACVPPWIRQPPLRGPRARWKTVPLVSGKHLRRPSTRRRASSLTARARSRAPRSRLSLRRRAGRQRSVLLVHARGARERSSRLDPP
jgi:hypothetical protein